jgi:hypothetical protein
LHLPILAQGPAGCLGCRHRLRRTPLRIALRAIDRFLDRLRDPHHRLDIVPVVGAQHDIGIEVMVADPVESAHEQAHADAI